MYMCGEGKLRGRLGRMRGSLGGVVAGAIDNYMLSVRVFNQFTRTHMGVTPSGWQEVVRAMAFPLLLFPNTQSSYYSPLLEPLLVNQRV